MCVCCGDVAAWQMLRRLPRRRRDGVAAAALGRGLAREEADQGGAARHRCRGLCVARRGDELVKKGRVVKNHRPRSSARVFDSFGDKCQ